MSAIEAFCSKDYTKKQGGMNLPEIKAELKKRGLNTTGNRSALREILCGKHKQPQETKPQEPKPQETKPQETKPQEPRPYRALINLMAPVEADLREKITRLTAACSGKSLKDGGYNVAQLAAIALKLNAPKTVRLREDYETFLKPHLVDLRAELKALVSGRAAKNTLNYNTLEGGFSLNQSRFGTYVTLSMDIYLNDNSKPTFILDEKIPLLETIRTSHIPALMSIVSDPTVMPDGKTWTPEKLTEFVKQGESDWLNRDIDPTNKNIETNLVGRRYDWTILSTDRTPVGVLSLFSRDNSKNYEIVLFIAASEQGNGLGTAVINALLVYIYTHLYNRAIFTGPVEKLERARYSLIESLTGHTNENNVAGESILRKTGFTFKENSVVDKKPVKVFTYDFSIFDKKRTEMEAMARKRESEIKAMFKEREKLQEQERRSAPRHRERRDRSPSPPRHPRHRERDRSPSPPRHRERRDRSPSPPRHRERRDRSPSPPRHRERDRMFREREKLQKQEQERRSRHERRERDRSPPRHRDQKSAKLSFYSGFVKGTTIDATYPSK